jgi:hypothetical protein
VDDPVFAGATVNDNIRELFVDWGSPCQLIWRRQKNPRFDIWYQHTTKYLQRDFHKIFIMWLFMNSTLKCGRCGAFPAPTRNFRVTGSC